jgi:citronellyl-CoA dehydrogenase
VAYRHPLFTDEHDELRASVRSWVESELQPHAQDWESEGYFPDWVFKRAGELGLTGVRYPVEVGGQGGDWGHTIVVSEELARTGSAGVGMGLAVQSDMATPPVLKFGTPEQHERYLKPTLRGEKIVCLGITEPNAGSDVANISTVAARDGDEWIINGAKTFITNAVRADYCVLVARTNKGAGYEGFSLFLVDTDLPGWNVQRHLDKLGMRSSDTGEISIEDVRVPASALLGEDGRGFIEIMWELQGERLIGASGSVAGAQLVLDRTIEYGLERHAFGKPIGTFQVNRHAIAEMATELEAARNLTYDVAIRWERGEYPVKEISMVKLYAAIVVNKVMNRCLQLFGGMGYSEEHFIERAWRDARLIRIGGGTDEVMREVISKSMGL